MSQPQAKQQPPFTLTDLKNAIPPRCWEKSPARSLFYFALDTVIIVLLFLFGSTVLDKYVTLSTIASALPFPALVSNLFAVVIKFFVYTLYWFLQGTMFWAYFVVGHDCGHRSFSDNSILNFVVGTWCHSVILVPFAAWRYSHRLHHASTAHVTKDETYRAIPKQRFLTLTVAQKLWRFQIFLIGFPVYLFYRDLDHVGNHFNPSDEFFPVAERNKVFSSVFCIALWGLFLLYATFTNGILFFVAHYFMPWVFFVIWISLVTYLHHTDVSVPWYTHNEWTYLKGALSTIDRDYGIFNEIHHNIGTHVVHHIFPQIPHYHLNEATEAIKPVLGDFYHKSDKGILGGFLFSFTHCQFLPDDGDVLMYGEKSS